MIRGTWFNRFAAEGGALTLSAETCEELATLDDKLFASGILDAAAPGSLPARPMLA
jgi:hypothetical protein